MSSARPAEVGSQPLADVSIELQRLLNESTLPPARYSVPDIRCRTEHVVMRDGVRLATDLYLPPELPAPVIVIRTPYGRSRDERGFVAALLAFARRGYVVASQDCRGTGESEPDDWDYYVFEPEDGYDSIEWIRRQSWCDGFIGSLGASYAGQTQWCMATHPAMSAIAPSVSGLGIAVNTTHFHMFANAYARSIGKGGQKIAVPIAELERLMLKETLASGYFNEPLQSPFSEALAARFPAIRQLRAHEAQRWLWEKYCGMTCAERAELIKQARDVPHVTFVDVESLPAIFGQEISHDRHTLPHTNPSELCRLIHAPPLLRTGWYDWALNDALATWQLFRREAQPHVAARARMIITPYAHAMPGYREGIETHPELQRAPTMLDTAGLHLLWYRAVREGCVDKWPVVTYYLMGANEWRVASDWPVPGARQVPLYLGADGILSSDLPPTSAAPDQYIYDPDDPTPTAGGSIVSFVYPPGSVDVSNVQRRADVLTFTSAPLQRNLDVVGPLRMILYARSSARDTDLVARLSDVFPDGRAIQLQNGILRTRHRNPGGAPELLEPGRIYRFEIDLWATANRFKAGHRLRLDLSSADFPRFDRNSNRARTPGSPARAVQTIHRDAEHPSHLLIQVLEGEI